MYIPRPFAEHRKEVLSDFIRTHPLATVVSPTSAGVVITHAPLLLFPGGDYGELRGHFARANIHARHQSLSGSTTAVFTDPGAYISPRWYASKSANGRVVPTWAYVAVHATGQLELVSDSSFLRAHLEALTDHHERAFQDPWHLSDAPEDYINQQLKRIVGVRIRIEQIEGKWKMDQNQSDADIDGVVNGLSASRSPCERRTAEVVQARRPVR